MRIRYDKADGFIKICNKVRHLVLLDEWCNKISNRIKHLITETSGITNSINRNFGKIRIDSYNSLHIDFS